MEYKTIKYRPLRSLLPVLFLISVFITSCYYDSEEDLYPSPQLGEVTYSADIAPIIRNSCAISGCHVTGGTGVGVFDSYEPVKRKVDEGSFRRRVLDRRDMPPSFSLPAIDLQKIEKWLNQGAPNN